MIFFGHIGIGNMLSKPLRKGLPIKWILFGTIFSDLIDKPLYYGLVYWTGRHGADLGLISSTRTFGHSALFLLALWVVGFFFKSRRIAAVSLGVATHLLLDGLTEHYSAFALTTPHDSALFWGILTNRFPVSDYRGFWDHILSWRSAFLISAEGCGLLLLGWDFWLRARREEILRYFSQRRIEARLRKASRKG